MLSMDFDSFSRQSNKQTLTRAKICHGDHGAPLPSSHSRLLRKLRHTLTLSSRWWYRETIAVWPECRGKLRGGKKNTSESCKQWHQSEPKHCQKALSKVAQNETPSDGLGRATIDWCFFILPNPIYILQVHDEQAAMLKRQLANHNAAKASWDAGVKGVGSGMGQTQISTSPWGCRCQSWTLQWTVSPSFRLPEANTGLVWTTAVKTNSRHRTISECVASLRSSTQDTSS